MSDKGHNPLGQETVYPTSYAPELLFPIARKTSRELLGLQESLPFAGQDVWTAYELSWLNAKGKPQVALAEFVFPCFSPCIIESKSFKLYLNSFNQTRLASKAAVLEILHKDLTKAAGVPLEINLFDVNDSPLHHIHQLTGICLDDLDIDVSQYHPQPEFLRCDPIQDIKETLYSNLLKSNCPVTGQPDWATLVIEYQGKKILHENLLAYIISFREHQDFHENCVERIFCDIQNRCKPEKLAVYARYTRRGGLDINPYRASDETINMESRRLVRQ